MSALEDTINQYLKTMGATITQPFADLPGSNPVLRFTVITHMNLNMAIILDGLFIWTLTNFGFLPKQNVVPLLRRLLNLNSKMAGPFFSVADDGGITLAILRPHQGLDLVEFRWMLDQMSGMFWQFAAGLVQEFQIPQQSG